MKISRLCIQLALAITLLTVFSLIPRENYINQSNAEDDILAVARLGLSDAGGLNISKQPDNTSLVDINLSDFGSAIEFPKPMGSDIYLNKQWAIQKIRAKEVWQFTTGDDVLVAVLDTGIDRYQEDLDGKVVSEINFTDSPSKLDVYGHGTHIAGIISASGDNGKGITGLAPESRLINVKVADDSGQTNATTVAKGIIWATDNGANVINLSLEFKEPSPELKAAVDYAWKRGVVIVAAAGNEGSGQPIYPAYYDNCIAVTATSEADALAPLSNFGNWVDVAAPGVNIYSTLPDNGYAYKSGTSFATAYVSGLSALLFSVVTDQNGDGRLNDEVRESIESGCLATGINTVHGRIDALRSYEIATSANSVS